MVYCTRCGEQNEEGTEYCKKCGVSLKPGSRIRHRRDDRELCFGVPMAGHTWGLIFGLVIVLWGISELLGFSFNFWAIFAVAFGLILLYNALQMTSRS
jgi:hypothetical protein